MYRPLISYCTTCKGRLHYLRETLPVNLKHNSVFFPQVEFVLLDYDSREGLQHWVTKTCRRYLDEGVLRFYSVRDREFYDSAHAKNVAHLLARGDILCNLDADNYARTDLTRRIWSIFQKNPRSIIRGGVRDTTGRLVLRRADFLSVGGYNETMEGYGYDDVDLLVRAKKYCGLREYVAADLDRFIPHSDCERAEHFAIRSVAESNEINREIMRLGHEPPHWIANQGTEWGAAEIYDQKRKLTRVTSCRITYPTDDCPVEPSNEDSRIPWCDRGIWAFDEAQRRRTFDAGLAEALMTVLPVHSPVLDLGCHVGRYLSHLAMHEYQCLGVEGTPGIVDIAVFDQIIERDLCEPLSIDWCRSSILCLGVANWIPRQFLGQLAMTLDDWSVQKVIVSEDSRNASDDAVSRRHHLTDLCESLFRRGFTKDIHATRNLRVAADTAEIRDSLQVLVRRDARC